MMSINNLNKRMATHSPPKPIEEEEMPSGLPLPSNITNGMDSLPQPRDSNARDNFLSEVSLTSFDTIARYLFGLL